ncbi:MAG: 4-hydroxy-tetrahydrodipicolinate synthase [Thermoleophilaceae bacterium]|jgi:4-hydroxy-tetrahydrodipicolinate synthase|nr:4-hydroxy-tetrahydrodipicolinate synthase [Thermoleophilaceae bacterium]
MAIGGVLTAMVTPFDAQGRVDQAAAVRLMQHLLDNGSDGLVLAGTTGEGATLTDEEKTGLWQLAVEEVGDRGYIVAGTGSNDTAHTVHLTERAAQIGVDAGLVVTPYYNKPNRQGIIGHYRAVAQAAPELPVIVYNIPQRCVVDIPNDLLRELAQISNVAAVKQARYEDVETIEGMDLLAGNDDVLARFLDLGATGGITVASHLFGREMRRMIDEPEARHEIHASLEDAFATLAIDTNPIPIKAAVAMTGLDVGGMRLPMVEASDPQKAEIRAMLERHGLLSAV